MSGLVAPYTHGASATPTREGEYEEGGDLCPELIRSAHQTLSTVVLKGGVAMWFLSPPPPPLELPPSLVNCCHCRRLLRRQSSSSPSLLTPPLPLRRLQPTSIANTPFSSRSHCHHPNSDTPSLPLRHLYPAPVAIMSSMVVCRLKPTATATTAITLVKSLSLLLSYYLQPAATATNLPLSRPLAPPRHLQHHMATAAANSGCCITIPFTAPRYP